MWTLFSLIVTKQNIKEQFSELTALFFYPNRFTCSGTVYESNTSCKQTGTFGRTSQSYVPSVVSGHFFLIVTKQKIKKQNFRDYSLTITDPIVQFMSLTPVVNKKELLEELLNILREMVKTIVLR